MIVVSDSSPLIALATVGHLDLLRELYREVLIPQAVRQEVVEDARDPAVAQQILDAAWIETATGSEAALPLEVGRLDPGEAAAIALALRVGADLLLVDDLQARMAAARMGIRITGMAGVLMDAKKHGMLPAVKPVLDQLSRLLAFRLGADLYQFILDTAGEL
ncbi:MAG TPA: DUF3368 domain-containing protein [Longimicrobium sp.]|nr:DUF3368 domain-containing protein [Longimicrobium sp.]